jgi:hypothetical protein
LCACFGRSGYFRCLREEFGGTRCVFAKMRRAATKKFRAKQLGSVGETARRPSAQRLGTRKLPIPQRNLRPRDVNDWGRLAEHLRVEPTS